LKAVGAVFSTISSVAKLPRVVARTPLTSGRTYGTSCRMSRPLVRACVWRFMLTPLMRTRFAPTACPGSWILSPSCRLFPLLAWCCVLRNCRLYSLGWSLCGGRRGACGLLCVRFGARASLSVCSRAAACVLCCWAKALLSHHSSPLATNFEITGRRRNGAGTVGGFFLRHLYHQHLHHCAQKLPYCCAGTSSVVVFSFPRYKVS
jgi:hypothetical protein